MALRGESSYLKLLKQQCLFSVAAAMTTKLLPEMMRSLKRMGIALIFREVSSSHCDRFLHCHDLNFLACLFLDRTTISPICTAFRHPFLGPLLPPFRRLACR